jgi:hypothetical protein
MVVPASIGKKLDDADDDDFHIDSWRLRLWRWEVAAKRLLEKLTRLQH